MVNFALMAATNTLAMALCPAALGWMPSSENSTPNKVAGVLNFGTYGMSAAFAAKRPFRSTYAQPRLLACC